MCVAEQVTEQMQESGICLSSDDAMTAEEVQVETHDEISHSAAVAVVTASTRDSSPPAPENSEDDAPPPLPSSLPPAASAFPPSDHDTSQDLSALVDDDPQSIVATATSPSSASTDRGKDRPTSLTGDYNPATEQTHSDDLGEDNLTDKYSTLSEDDRLLVQRMLSTAKEHQVTATQETEQTLAGDDTNTESEQKYSDLSEAERRLVETTLRSLGHREPDVQDVTSEENVDHNVRELRSAELADEGSGKNVGEGESGKDSASSNETKTLELAQDEDKESDKDAGEEVEDVPFVSTLADDVSIIELTVTTDQSASTVTSLAGDLNTAEPPVGNAVDSLRENCQGQTVTASPEINDISASDSQEPDSANRLVSSATVSPDGVNVSEEHDGRQVDENNSERTVVVRSQVGDNEAPETQERSTSVDGRTDDVFHSDTSDTHSAAVAPQSAPSAAHSCEVETDALFKSRRTLVSDEAVSGILRDYYTAEPEPEVEEQKPEKPKPVKPLIAQALLPKASRRAAGKLNTTGSATAAATSLQTSSSFSTGKPAYHRIEVPRAIISSERSEEDQRSKPETGHEGDDVAHDSGTVRRSSDVSPEKSTNSDTVRDDGRQVPTIAESRAFFKSCEAALGTGPDKSVPVQPSPVTESSLAAPSSLTQVTSSRAEVGETRAVEAAALPQAAEETRQPAEPVTANSLHVDVEVAAKSPPLEAVTRSSQDGLPAAQCTADTVSADTNSLPTSPKVQTEIPKVTDSRTFFESKSGGGDGGGTTASKGRAQLTTRWAPKPFSLAATTTKSTPGFVTFDPVRPAGKTPENTESDGPTDNRVEATKVESRPSSNGSDKTGSKTAPTESKPSWTRSLSALAATSGAVTLVDGSSTAVENDRKSKSGDVKTGPVESIDVGGMNAMSQASEPQSPRSPPLSAAAMATELKKMSLKTPTRTSSTSGPSASKAHVPHPHSAGLGRSFSMSHADAQPQRLLANGSKSTNRGPPTGVKSWTQFDYRKNALPVQPESANSTSGAGQEGRTSSRDVDEEVEHIDVASSKAFFRAAELAEKQPLSQPGTSYVAKKHGQTSTVKAVAPLKDDEKVSAAAADVDLSSSSESSCSSHSAPLVMSHGI